MTVKKCEEEGGTKQERRIARWIDSTEDNTYEKAKFL
jgi:hypothetical protein